MMPITPSPKTADAANPARRMLRRSMELLGGKKPRSFKVLATRPKSMYIEGRWSFTAHDDEHLLVRPSKDIKKRSPSYVLKLVKASIRKLSKRKDSKLESSENVDMHFGERTTMIPEVNNISRVPTVHESDDAMPGLERVTAHDTDNAIPMQYRVRALSNFINYTHRVPTMREMDDIMPGLYRTEAHSDYANAMHAVLNNSTSAGSSDSESDSDSDFEYYDSEEDQVMCIPRGLRGVMYPIVHAGSTPRFSLSSSSLDTVIHHENMSGPHVATIADVYNLYQPRLLPGPAREPVLQLPEDISDSSSAEVGGWDTFIDEVMVTRTLSQCQRVTMGFKRGLSQRTRISTIMERYETREADSMPLLNRSRTNESAVSYRYLGGPCNLVVTNP